MARTQTMVQLTDDLVSELDALAQRRGSSRSALIREAVWAMLNADAERHIGERIAAGYRRIPPAAPDEWGDIDEQADLATAELARQLDAEERRHGGPTW